MCVERVGGEAGRGALVRGGADGHGRGRSGRGGGGGGDGHAWVEKGGWTGLGSWVEVDSAGRVLSGRGGREERRAGGESTCEEGKWADRVRERVCVYVSFYISYAQSVPGGLNHTRKSAPYSLFKAQVYSQLLPEIVRETETLTRWIPEGLRINRTSTTVHSEPELTSV